MTTKCELRKTAKKSQEATKSSVITKMFIFRITLFLNCWDCDNKLLTYVMFNFDGCDFA